MEYFFLKTAFYNQARWWRLLLIPAIRRQRLADFLVWVQPGLQTLNFNVLWGFKKKKKEFPQCTLGYSISQGMLRKEMTQGSSRYCFLPPRPIWVHSLRRGLPLGQRELGKVGKFKFRDTQRHLVHDIWRQIIWQVSRFAFITSKISVVFLVSFWVVLGSIWEENLVFLRLLFCAADQGS